MDSVGEEMVADDECYSAAFPSEVLLAQTSQSILFHHVLEDTRGALWT